MGIVPNMRSHAQRAEILRLVEEGINDCEIARRTGVPRTTVRDIRRGPRPDYCPRCWRRINPLGVTAERYAELLGLYLGDGCISRLGRTYSLRISLDAKYPGLIAETKALVGSVFPDHYVGVVRVDGAATRVVCVYSLHLPCLFPQHGTGKKHLRRIVLESWQEDLVRAAPWRFLRGCIRSDGCAFVNRTGKYEYLSYHFANRSADILDLFCAACELVGAEYRRYEESIRINKRASVALFESHIGLKF